MSIESLNAFSMDFFSLKGKTAIVTGGNSGLGQTFAMALAKAGANIFIPSFVKDNGETKEMIEKQGVEVDFMQVDITAEGAPQKIIAACCERFGTVDILVNNAGGGGPKPFDMPMADFRRAYELNVFSFFHLSQLVAPEMEKNGGGVILTITSMAAENKNINMTSYASSKAAASHLVRNMAFDLGEKNIRVNGIAPGAILTDALKSVITPEIEQKMLQHTPIRRLGQPQDIANAALFLCSPAASWVSGQILTVSGGGVQELN